MSKFLHDKKQVSVDTTDIFWKNDTTDSKGEKESVSSINFYSYIPVQDYVNKDDQFIPSYVDLNGWNDVFNLNLNYSSMGEENNIMDYVNLMVDKW